jgi:hypothetical protein
VICLISEAARKGRKIAMSDQFPIFHVILKKRGRTTWRWWVRTNEGNVVMDGSESSRPTAKYAAERALFLLLLSAPYRMMRLGKLQNSSKPAAGAR